MLEVQKYLKSGKTLDDLNKELGITAAFHKELPLVILNYDQIDSPKTNLIVRECRALVLNTQTYDLVARSFHRFFNGGEYLEETAKFDFKNCYISNKEDGSLCLIYWFQDRWMCHTRGSFDMENQMNGTTFTWASVMKKALKVKTFDELQLRKDLTYVSEFCSLHNKVVRKYDVPVMYLLTAFQGEKELHYKEVDTLVTPNFVRVGRKEFKSFDEISDYLRECETKDPTFEGFVGCDPNMRVKWKSLTYLAWHRMAGPNLFHPKYLLPQILAGEADEFLCHFSEVTETFRKFEKITNDAFAQLVEVWEKYHKIADQKEFALAIQGKTPFTSMLFNLRKLHGANQELRHLKHMWRNGADQILKVLFKNAPPMVDDPFPYGPVMD